MNKRLLITLGTALLLLSGTLLAIKFAKGYRLNLKEQKVNGTGLLVANSFPEGASVFINDKLTTATDDTLNLPPGNYKIKIVKDGFIDWEKNLILKEELVTQTNTRLFPAVPDLKGLTFAGALNLTPSPDGQKIAFSVASSSASLKNGLWILDLASSALSFSQEPRQISQNSKVFDFTEAQLIWAPDSKQILCKDKTDTVLLDADRMNEAKNFKDVNARLPIILDDWEEQLSLKKQRQILKLPEEMQKIASESARKVYFSPDEEKMLYTATTSSIILQNLIPPLPATNTQPEQRQLEPDKIYIYDIKEDKNFYIMDAKIEEDTTGENTEKEAIETKPVKDAKTATKQEKEKTLEKRLKSIQNQYSPLNTQLIQWFPTSQHLVLIEEDKIIILEYDNTNKAVVYAGPFEESFTYPWPDGSKLLILTTLNSESSLPSNLYAIDLK